MLDCQDFTCKYATTETRYSYECAAAPGKCPRRDDKAHNCDGCKYLIKVDCSVVTCRLNHCVDYDPEY